MKNPFFCRCLQKNMRMKLHALLCSLHPDEYRAFEKFLQSPYFKESEQYLRFFQYLVKRHPGFEMDVATLREACQRSLKVKSLTDPQWHNLTSGLSKQIEMFLVAQLVLDTVPSECETDWYGQLLVRALGVRNMNNHFRQQAETQIKKNKNSTCLHADIYLNTYQLYHQIYYNPDTPKSEEYASNLQESIRNLDLYFCIAKLRDAAELKARELILDVQYEPPMLLEEVLQYCAGSGTARQHPLLMMYYRLNLLYQNGIDEAEFRQTKELFDTLSPDLSHADRTLILRHLTNCGISLVARHSAVEAELLSLYKKAIESGVLLMGNRITHASFVNIANLASLCQEFDWALEFIDQFSGHLEKSKKKPSVLLAKAGVFYNQQALDAAQKCLSQDVFAIQPFDILGRGLLIKIAFDRYLMHDKDYEFLQSLLNAFEKYIPGRTLTDEKKKAQINWIKMVRKMSKIRFDLVNVTDAKKMVLRQKLQELKPVVYKKWLDDRVELL